MLELLSDGVVLCGGGAKFAGIEARLSRELTELVPGVPTVVVANPPGNRALAAWLGGALVDGEWEAGGKGMLMEGGGMPGASVI